MHSSTSNDPTTTSTTTSGMHTNHATPPPSAYTPTRPSQTRRLSSESTSSTMTTSPTSIRRKPVSYLSSEEIPWPPRSNYLLQQGSRAGSSVTLPSFALSAETGNKQDEDKPPVYILDVDLDVPVPATDNQAEEHQTSTLIVAGGGDQAPIRPSTPPPTYAYPPTSPSSSHSAPTLPLPTYTATPSTEPTTLPRQLFTYGFLCPLLWALGAVLLCVPLKVYEEDFDLDFETRRGGQNVATSSAAGVTEQERAEEEGRLQGMKKRERELLDEKVLILRRAELRWARYCATAFACFLGVVIVVVVAVVLFVTRR